MRCFSVPSIWVGVFYRKPCSMHQELKSERTKQLIIDQAFQSFYENDLKTTSIDTIMKTTALTKGAFNHQFESKKKLVLAVSTSKL